MCKVANVTVCCSPGMSSRVGSMYVLLFWFAILKFNSTGLWSCSLDVRSKYLMSFMSSNRFSLPNQKLILVLLESFLLYGILLYVFVV